MTYEVHYKNKIYYYKADDAIDAFNIFSNRKVFGKNFAKESKLLAIDRETRGYRWALYAVEFNTNTSPQRVKVKLVSDEIERRIVRESS